MKDRESGTILAVVLMIMMLLTLGGVSAIRLSMMESFIVRNAGLYKQNLHLAEAAAMEGVREILNEKNPSRLKPGEQQWVWRIQDWEDSAAKGIPQQGYAVPRIVTENIVTTVKRRGEEDCDTLRYYLAGWEAAGGSSLNSGQTNRWRKGRVIGVYDSPRYGRAWVEVGIVKKF